MSRPKPSDTEAGLIRYAQNHKTARLLIVAVLAGFCILQIRIGFVEYVKKEPWENVALHVLQLFAGLSFPSLIIRTMWRKIRKLTARLAPRAADLEQQLDPNRSSSHLNPDGTDPEEAHP